jgi:hypothetical protein
MTTADYDARLMVASLTAPRFKGRSALIALAQKGYEEALQALEMSSSERDFNIRKGAFTPVVMNVLRELPIVAELEALRRTRKGYTTDRDAIAERPQGNVIRRSTLLAFERALEGVLEPGYPALVSRFRTAMHSHENVIKYVEPGHAGATSISDSIWASEAGLSGAYRKKAYRVATSKHVWSVSPEILKVPAARRWDGKHLWLTPNLRVRQGRGTSLVSETVR